MQHRAPTIDSRLALLATIALLAACHTREAAEPAAWTPAALIDRGAAALASGDGARAEQYLTLAIDRGASVDVALPLLLAACIEGDRLETALAHAERYRRRVTDPSRLAVLVGALHLALGHSERAVAELDRALAGPDAPALAYYLRGVAIGDPRAADADLAHYLELDPDGRYRVDAESRRSRGAGR